MVTTPRITAQNRTVFPTSSKQVSFTALQPQSVSFSGAEAFPRQVISHYGNILVQQASALKYYPAIIASMLLVTFRSLISWGSSIKARGTAQQDYAEKQAYTTTFREVGAFFGTYGFMKIFEANRKRYLLRLIGLGTAETKMPIQAPFAKLPAIIPTLKSAVADLWHSLREKRSATELAPTRLYLEAADDFSKADPTKFLSRINGKRFFQDRLFKGWMRLSKWFDADARSISLSASNLADPKKLETVLKAVTKYAPITAGAVLATALSGVLLEWFTIHKMDGFTRWLSGVKPTPSTSTQYSYGAVPVAAQSMITTREVDTFSASQKANMLFQQFQRNQ